MKLNNVKVTHSVHGIRIPLNNIHRAVVQKRFDSVEEIEKDLDGMIQSINDIRQELIDLYTSTNECKHEKYGESSYTIRRMLMGYYTCYERTCVTCKFTEYKSCENESEKPEWAIDAKQKYYNNF